jgi:lysophospholipase L1-like esterase
MFQRKITLKTVKRLLLGVVASGATLVLAGTASEVYLRQRATFKIVPYSAELYTHDGRKVSVPAGEVKLALAPFTVFQNLPSQHTEKFNINSHGLRDDEGAEQDSRLKVIFLGGSAAFGQGAATDSDTIPAILQQSINTHRVVNAGVTGFQSGQELTFLVTDLIDYKPAIVIAYDGWNDVFDGARSPQRGVHKLGFNNNFFKLEDELAINYRTQVSSSASLSRLLETSAGKSLVLRRFSQAISSRQTQRPIQTIRDLPEAGQKDLMDRIVATYVNNVRKMAVFSQASGAKFLLVFQPELGQRSNPTAAERELLNTMVIGDTSYDFFPALYRQFLAAAKPLLTQEGVAWIDTNESSLFQTAQQTLFADPVHTNRRGNEIAAQIIAERLRPFFERK